MNPGQSIGGLLGALIPVFVLIAAVLVGVGVGAFRDRRRK